jgi:hypothetical protein
LIVEILVEIAHKFGNVDELGLFGGVVNKLVE